MPVRIEGTYRLMEKNNYWIKPAKVQVKILPPVETKGLSREEVKGLGEQLRQMVAQALPGGQN